jgi:TRAP-type C4-dicarboxylate transport system substrate-binding protein
LVGERRPGDRAASAALPALATAPCVSCLQVFDKSGAMPFHRRIEKHNTKPNMEERMKRVRSLAGAVLLAISLPFAAQAQVTLRASHQFPGGKGDARDEMVQIIAREAKAANVGLDVQVFPGASLFKPKDQWNAMVNGQLDISSFPLDYASGKVRAFSATLMPGLVRNHERAARLSASPFMKDIKAKIEKAGVVVLADAWLAGAFGSKKECIRKPDDLKGQKIRSAGSTFARMWQQAGASIVTIPSNEVYNALQTGVIEATDTSAGSFVSFRLYEQIKCLTAPGENALWFMYEPVLMSKKSFNKLNKAQQDALLAAGKKAEAYFKDASKKLDDRLVDTFKKNNVEVITLTPEEFDAWVNLAKQSSYKVFSDEVPDGKKLIDGALATK